MVKIQLNLFGEGISDKYVDAKKLKHSKRKLHKKCGIKECKEMIPNKPSSKFCSDCIINQYLAQDLIIQPQSIYVSNRTSSNIE